MQFDDEIRIPGMKGNSMDDRRITLKSKHQAPVTRYRDTPEKQVRRITTDKEIRKEFRRQADILIPKLRQLGYRTMARFIDRHVKLDARSHESIQGIRAGNLLLQNQKAQAQEIMTFITGRDIFLDDSKDAPIRHKHESNTGGVEMIHLKVTAEITDAFNKELLKNIGSGRE